ncbi:MAG: sigma-54 dependent transcriptional regulator [Proteobacteria bacterium]|nr:sigma-54 dependent transcriptional regulator [Pseudomonadota bacterium]MBU1640532.1 sigma-54 dependent transcriptional regulator [Pseudomonadota bacterium]
MSKNQYPLQPVLLVDDEEVWLHSFSLTLRSAGINNILTCQDSRAVLDILNSQAVSLMVLDLTMPHINGAEILIKTVEEFPHIPVIIISGLDQVETAVNCIKQGAFDYFTKVSEENRLVSGVERAIEVGKLRRENSSLKEHFLEDRLDHPEAFAHIITRNKKMRTLFQYMEAIAASCEPVLITGETGVGKELFAQALHKLCHGDAPFVVANAAGLDDTMFADTLFGHRKGAFTSADSARDGLIKKAAGGTLFLDEIGDLSQSSQVKLLRLLQEKEYFQLGSDLARKTNARMIFATHRDLDTLQKEGAFRTDLFFRLRAHHIHIPPLRERLDDLPLLFDFFLEEGAKKLAKKKPAYPKELTLLMATYTYPGNIRELNHIIFDALSHHKDKMLSMENFKKYIHNQSLPSDDAVDRTLPKSDDSTLFSVLNQLPTLKESSNLLIQEALHRSGGNQAIAADMLGITRQALNWRLKKS